MPFQVPSDLVLVVDDDPAIHRLIGRLLRLHGFRPLLASTPQEAIELADRYAVDAFILDLGLRGAHTGLDVLRSFRTRPRYHDVPVLILTGRPTLSAADEATLRQYRADVFFKPQKLHVLIDHLKHVLRDRHPAPRGAAHTAAAKNWPPAEAAGAGSGV